MIPIQNFFLAEKWKKYFFFSYIRGFMNRENMWWAGPIRIVSFSFCSYFSHCNNGDHIPNSNWGGLNFFKFLAVESRDVSQAVNKITVAKAFQRWANSQNDNYIFSLKMVKSCHFEWKQLSFFKFARLWQHLKFVFSKKATKLHEIFTVNLRLTT